MVFGRNILEGFEVTARELKAFYRSDLWIFLIAATTISRFLRSE
jgi:hypothetical protein